MPCQEGTMAISDRKGIRTAMAFSLVGIVTGLVLTSDLLPSQAAHREYDESMTTSKTVLTIMHTHDEISQHEHIMTTVVTITETTPHGSFHDFALTVSPAATPMQTESTPARGANEIWVVIREFRPSSITVPVGATVTWTNKHGEGEMHTVKSSDGLFDGTILSGGSFSYTFTERGTFSYYCEPHPEMGGTVIVR